MRSGIDGTYPPCPHDTCGVTCITREPAPIFRCRNCLNWCTASVDEALEHVQHPPCGTSTEERTLVQVVSEGGTKAYEIPICLLLRNAGREQGAQTLCNATEAHNVSECGLLHWTDEGVLGIGGLQYSVPRHVLLSILQQARLCTVMPNNVI